MNKILELREKRNKIWNTAKEFLDQKRGADGFVPAEAAAEYDKIVITSYSIHYTKLYEPMAGPFTASIRIRRR